MAVPLAEAKDPTTDQQQQVALVGVGAIVAATGLGWLFGGRAVRPLVELTQRVGRRDRDRATAASGVREADELAAAAGAMLQDVSDASEAETFERRWNAWQERGRVREIRTRAPHRHRLKQRGQPCRRFLPARAPCKARRLSGGRWPYLPNSRDG